MSIIQEAIYAIRNMHTGITYQDSSVNRVIDDLEKLKIILEYQEEGMSRLTEELAAAHRFKESISNMLLARINK